MTKEEKTELFYEEFNKRYDGEYVLLSEYNGSHGLISARHVECGNIRTSEARRFFTQGCKVCERKRYAQERALNNFKRNMIEIEEKYNVCPDINTYKGYDKPMSFMCKVCGQRIVRTIEDALTRTSIICKHVTEEDKQLLKARKGFTKSLKKYAKKRDKKAREEESILNLCIQYEDRGFDILDIDDNCIDVLVRHRECGRVFTTTKRNISRGYGCRACSRCGLSEGVRQISAYLDEYSYTYIREKAFPTCRRKYVLPFDFVIMNDDGTIRCIIEYNGEQHYRATEYFGGEEKLKAIQECDAIKKEWCDKNAIPFLVVKWNENVEEVLERFLLNEK